MGLQKKQVELSGNFVHVLDIHKKKHLAPFDTSARRLPKSVNNVNVQLLRGRRLFKILTKIPINLLCKV